MATNGYQCSYERNKPTKASNIYEVDALTTLAALVEAITKWLDIVQVLSQAPVMCFET